MTIQAVTAIDLSDVIVDPDFCQTFTVFRSTGEFVKGGYQETVTEIPMTGIVTHHDTMELNMTPEGDRIRGMMDFYSIEPLYVTHVSGEQGTSDKIQWQGEQYKLVKIHQYNDYGYVKAVGERIVGD